MSRFVGDAQDFRRPGEPRVLVLTQDLLDELHVTDASRPEQERVVRIWLEENEPNQVLALSLREDGFAAESLSNDLSNEPQPTEPDDGGRATPGTLADLYPRGRGRTKTDPPDRQAAGS